MASFSCGDGVSWSIWMISDAGLETLVSGLIAGSGSLLSVLGEGGVDEGADHGESTICSIDVHISHQVT
jgi:hypothetical protein